VGAVNDFFMSWTDIFPVLDDELLEAYEEGVTDSERAEFEEWFGVREIKIKERGRTAPEEDRLVCETPTLLEKHIVSAKRRRTPSAPAR